MVDIKWNKAGQASLERQMQQKFDAAAKEANKAADQHDTPEAKAAAFSRVLKRHGIDPNRAEITRKFRDLME